jgi:type III restriction enzyme
VGGYVHLYPAVRDFLRDHLFESPVDLVVPNTLRNLSEPEVTKLVFVTFTSAINALTVEEAGTSRLESQLRLRETRPFLSTRTEFTVPQKSVFNKIVGEVNAGGFELSFAAFLEDAKDVVAFAKNYLAIGFKLDYVRANGDLSNYTPDFIVRSTDGTVWIVETKGREEIDVPQKMKRLRQWCEDATTASAHDDRRVYRFVFVDQTSFERHPPTNMAGIAASFTEYQA